MRTATLFLTILLSVATFAQSGNLAVFTGANLQPVLSGRQVAFEMGGRYYLHDHISLGAHLGFTSKSHNDNFGYNTTRTKSTYLTPSVIIQYDFFNNETFVGGVFIGNGINHVTLNDLDNTVIEDRSYEQNGIWYTKEVEVPGTLNRDLFYMMTPGVDLSLKLVTLRKFDNVKLYLTSRIAYQVPFGKGDFVQSSDLKGFVFALGVTFKGEI